MRPSRAAAAFAAIVTLTVFSACAPRPADTAKPDDGHLLIGFAMDSLTVERWQRDLDIFIASAGTLGADVLSQNANNDPVEQERQIMYLLDQGIDVLVIVPTDATLAARATLEAKRRGVKVMAYDRLVVKGGIDLFVSFDSVEVGRLMALEAVRAMPRGRYLLINGAPTDNNSHRFREGFLSVLRPLAEQGRISLLPEAWAEHWAEDRAYQTVDGLLARGVVPDAIIAANDGLAGGAIQALAERRLAGTLPVVGNDADLLACQRIVEGTQLATIYKPIPELAAQAAQAAVDLARGTPIATTQRIDDGETDIPWIVLEPIPVTAANLDDVLARTGFHKAEDIYPTVRP